MRGSAGDLSDDDQGCKIKLNFTTPQKRNDGIWNQISTGDDYSRRLFTSNKKMPEQPQVCENIILVMPFIKEDDDKEMKSSRTLLELIYRNISNC